MPKRKPIVLDDAAVIGRLLVRIESISRDLRAFARESSAAPQLIASTLRLHAQAAAIALTAATAAVKSIVLEKFIPQAKEA